MELEKKKEIPEQKISDEEMIAKWLESNEITVVPEPKNFYFGKMYIEGHSTVGEYI